MNDKRSKAAKPVWGEGNYSAARRYDAEQAAFAKSGMVEAKAKEAKAALEGPEAADLEAARKSAAKGKPQTER